MGRERQWKYVKQHGDPPDDGLFEVALVTFTPDRKLQVYADRWNAGHGWDYFTLGRLLSVNGQIYAWRIWETSVNPPPCDIMTAADLD